MKYFILCALLTSLSLSSLRLEAQSIVTRKQKTVQPKPSAKPKAQKAKSTTSSKPRSHSSASSTVSLQPELDKLANSMVYVQGGTFMMGANTDDMDALDWEKPRHQVSLNSFYISKYEVTQALWTAVMGNNPSRFKGGNLPVDRVSWDDCQMFIRKLNSITGYAYRLPTEAEWEFAARGGNISRGYKYCGSNSLDDVAWFYSNSNNQTHPVGTRSPNELGIYDMLGNVGEWCSNLYETYSSTPQSNPLGPSEVSYPMYVYRGANWHLDDCRISGRGSAVPDTKSDQIGFRLAHSYGGNIESH